VLVELFTSEGCSSCPPADLLLESLNHNQPVPGVEIIPLEEHVDYWNRLGWSDPFSAQKFTERQQSFAIHFGNSGPYTPQMVVDGRTEFVGSSSQQALEAIAAEATSPKAEISLILTGGAEDETLLMAKARGAAPTGDRIESVDIRLAITEDGLASDVRNGENAGRRVEHSAVVRELRDIGRCGPGKSFVGTAAIKLAPQWKRENLRVVVFLEGSSSGRILGAASASVPR
jgi:hypothetical protein